MRALTLKTDQKPSRSIEFSALKQMIHLFSFQVIVLGLIKSFFLLRALTEDRQKPLTG